MPSPKNAETLGESRYFLVLPALSSLASNSLPTAIHPHRQLGAVVVYARWFPAMILLDIFGPKRFSGVTIHQPEVGRR